MRLSIVRALALVAALTATLLGAAAPTLADDLAAKTADGNSFKFRAFDLGNGVFLPAHGLLDNGGNPYTNLSPLPTAQQDAVVPAGSPFSAAGTGTVFTADTLGFQSVAVQLTGTFVQTFVAEVSVDNANWLSVAGTTPLNTGSTAPITTMTTAGIYTFPTVARYFRLRSSAYTSGTATVSAALRAVPMSPIGVNVGGGSVTATLGTGSASVGGIGATSVAGGISAPFRIASSAASTNLTQVKAAAGRVYRFGACNTTTSPIRIKVYNALSANVTVGTTAPFMVRTVPQAAGAGQVSCATAEISDIGWYLGTGISVALVTGAADSDATAVAAGAITDLQVDFQ